MPAGDAFGAGGRPGIDFDAISDPSTLKTLLRAQHEKLGALERRILSQDGASNAGGGTSSTKVETLEQLVVALRRKLQHRTDQVKLLVVRAKQHGDQVESGILDGVGELLNAPPMGDVLMGPGNIQREEALEAALNKANNEIAGLHRSNDTLSRDLAVARSLSSTSQTTWADQDVAMLERRCRAAEEKLRVSHERVAELRDGFSRMSTEKRIAEERLAAFSAQQTQQQSAQDAKMHARVSQLEQQLSQAKEEVARKADECRRQAATIVQREEALDQARAQIGRPTQAAVMATEALKQQVEQLTSEKRQAWSANDELRVQNDRLSTERDSLRRHLDAKGKTYDDSERIVRVAQESVMNVQKELQRVIAERDALATSRGLAASGDGTLKHENDTLRKRLTAREAASREKMADLEATVNISEQRRQEAQASLDQAREELDTMRADHASMREDLMQAQAEVPERVRVIEDLRQKLDVSQHEAVSLTKRLQQAFEKEAKYKDWDENMSQQEAAKADLREAINQLSMKNAEAIRSQEESRTSITNLQNRVSELTRDVHLRGKELEAERSKAHDLSRALAVATESARKAGSASARATELQEVVKAKEIVIEDLRSRSDDERRGASARDADVASIRATVEQQRHTIDVLEGQLADMAAEIKGKDEEVARMNTSKSALVHELDDARATTADVHEVEKLRGESGRLRRQLDNAHEMMKDLQEQVDRQSDSRESEDALRRALEEKDRAMQRKDLEVEAYKSSSEDLRRRLLAVSEENRAMVDENRLTMEKMRGRDSATDGHVAQLRQQLVSAVEMNQMHARKNALLKDRMRVMKELFERHAESDDARRKVAGAFDSYLDSVEKPGQSQVEEERDMDRLLVAALQAGNQQQQRPAPASRGRTGGGTGNQDYDWLYGMNSAGADADGQEQDDGVPEIVL